MKKFVLLALLFVWPCMAMEQREGGANQDGRRNSRQDIEMKVGAFDSQKDRTERLRNKQALMRRIILSLATTSCCGGGVFLTYVVSRLLEYERFLDQSDQALIAIFENATKSE